MSGNAGSILVVDDERDIGELVQLTLEDLGLDVILSYSGEEGLEIIRSEENEIQLLFLDLSMPGLSGMDVLEIVRKEFPQLPVIIMSGSVRDKSEFMAEGAVDVLPKPFMLSDVEEKVRAAIGI